MATFKAQPYFYLAFRLIPNYPIDIYNQNGGVQFNQNGEFITEDKIIIDGIRALIERHERARALEVNKKLNIPCPIQEYKAGKPSIPLDVPIPEPNYNGNDNENAEMARRVRYLLRL